jgi:hypothetical protein
VPQAPQLRFSEPLGKTPADLSWVAATFRESGKRLVVEDFHYVAEEQQKRCAFILKALGEYGVYLVIVGIWPQDHLLTYYNGDLEGRVEDIHLQWTNDELNQVLSRGADALNMRFSDPLRGALIVDAYGNVGLLQRLAEQVCLQDGIGETQAASRTIDLGPTLDQARSAVASQMREQIPSFRRQLRTWYAETRGRIRSVSAPSPDFH